MVLAVTGNELEERSLWHNYKSKVWLDETPETAAIHNIMRVLRSVRNSGDLVYVSVPVTSGKFLYEQKLAYPEMAKGELLQKVMFHNYQKGWVLVETIQTREKKPVLYPADLVPARQKWTQSHFQALWLSIISEKCTEVHMTEDWEYSNGASEELTHTFQLKLGLPSHPQLFFYNTKENEKTERERMKNIKICDHLGSQITLEDSIKKIDSSLEWINNRGFDTDTLRKCRELLIWTGDKIDKGFYQ